MRYLALLVAASAALLTGCEDPPTSPGTQRPSGTPVSAMITAQTAFVSTTVATGGAHTCALTSSGAAYCWGSNGSGQLGDGTANQCTYNVPCNTIPVAVTGGLTFSRIAAGTTHTCAIATSGQTYCWGSNNTGQLGNGTTTQSRVPVLVAGGHTFTQISGGNAQTCAVTAAGAAYCWGYNLFAMLGDGTTTDRLTPTPVAGGLAFASVSTGLWHSCGVTTGNAAYCWGRNDKRQLGATSSQQCVSASSYPCSKAPLPVAGGISFKSVDAGGMHSCGVTTSGGGRCWGYNISGQVGNGSATGSGNPIQTPAVVSGGHVWRSIVAGGYHTCGVTTGDAAYCWGLAMDGQLGINSTNNVFVPTAVWGGRSYRIVNGENTHTCGITTANEAYCWGANGSGQLGDGTRFRSTIPVAVGDPTNRTPIADAGGPYSGAVDDGILIYGSNSTDPDGDALTYNWDFGDNSTGIGRTVTHLYQAAGVYTVRLIVTDPGSLKDTAFSTATISNGTANQAPVAVANGPYSGNEGAGIAFSGAGSSDPEGGALTYSWNFGDGTTSALANPSKKYADNKKYAVTLTVTDPAGAPGSASTTATTANVAPTATWSAPSSTTEGTSYTLALHNGTDAGTADRTTLQYAFDCGRGTGFGAFSSQKSVICAAFPDQLANQIRVRGQMKDKDGGITTYARWTSITNAAPAPTVSTMTPTTFASGGSLTLSGSFSDKGANDTPWKYGYYWGDGTIQSTGKVSAQGSVPAATHTYPSAGTYLVRLRVTDKDGKAGFSKTITITVTP